VDTHFLRRGLTQSQISEGSFVRGMSGPWWTPTELPAPPAHGGWAHQADDLNGFAVQEGLCGSGVPEEWVRRAPTAGEALLFALVAAVKATRATAGLLHRAREPFVGLVTSSAHGPAGTEAELGQIISRHDEVLAAAQRRQMVMGSKDVGGAERAIARRFSACGPDLRAVAMVPVFDGETLLAMLELGRADHGFRVTDGEMLRVIAAKVGLP
jgi:hypothetical protein